MSGLRELRQSEALGNCVDRLLAGRSWDDALPEDEEDRTEIVGLLAVARRLFDFGREMPAPENERRRELWNRVNRARGLLRRMAFYRLPYLPPLLLRPKAAC